MADQLVEVKVTGVLEFKKKLDDLSSRQITTILRDALDKVGRFWKYELKAVAPDTPPKLSDYPDELRKSIDYWIRGQGKGKQGAARFILTVGPAMVPPRPRKNKKYKLVSKGSGKQVVKEINEMTPGIYARFLEYGTKGFDRKSFMRPVFESTADEVIETVRSEVLKGVNAARVK